METDFLNFHDEEHFGTGLYQHDLLEDSQSSLLDIVGDDYSRQDSVIWEQDVEQEINGDVAVIPMSGRIDTFPKFSNSPPTKEFHRIFSEWHEHLASIEAPSTGLTDLNLPHQHLVSDMLECFTPSSITSNLPETIQANADAEPVVCPANIKREVIEPDPSLPFTVEPASFKQEPDHCQLTAKPQLQGGKNLELLKKVVKQELIIGDEDEKHVDEFEDVDHFDITTYINPEYDLLCPTGFCKLEVETKECDSTDENDYDHLQLADDISTNKDVLIKSAKTSFKNKNTYKSKHISYKTEDVASDDDSSCNENVNPSSPISKEKNKNTSAEKQLTENTEEDDCVDVETVSEQMPVLEACDLKSLLEQFEASEAMNPKSTKIKTDTAASEPDKSADKLLLAQELVKKRCENRKKTFERNRMRKQENNMSSCNKRNKNINEFPKKLLQKFRASNSKKSISVIPAIPTKRRVRNQNQEITSKQKVTKVNNTNTVSVGLSYSDHDYCCTWPQNGKASQETEKELKTINRNEPKIIDTKIRKVKELDLKKSGKVIDDTALRIKNALNNEKLNLSQDSLLKNQPMVRSADGKLMISLLKTNNRLSNSNVNLSNRINKSTVINTVQPNDEKIQTVIDKSLEQNKINARKRKLNLEEYKKLRGDVKLSQSCDNSRNNSPLNSGASSPLVHQEKEKQVEENYREIMSKMASEILKANVKSKPVTLEATLKVFVPPDMQKRPETDDLKTTEEEILNETVKQPKQIPKASDNYEIITIVSIGVNTDRTYFNLEKPEAKINPEIKTVNDNKTEVDKTKLTEMITPILQNANAKINSNSLITNITETLLQKSPSIDLNPTNIIESSIKPIILRTNVVESVVLNKSLSSKFENLGLKLANSITRNGKFIPKNEPVMRNEASIKCEDFLKSKNCLRNKSKISYNEHIEHGEDKTIIVLDKNSEKPARKSTATQTDKLIEENEAKHSSRQIRIRRSSSESSSDSNSSPAVKNKKMCNPNRQSSSNSISSSLGSRYSRSRSRSKTRSISSSDCFHSSYLSDSSRSRSRSISPARWHTNRTSRSRHRSYRSRKRYRSNSYRSSFVKSRSPYSRSRSRRRKERENAEERMKEVEERRVIYVGKISDNTTKADLRRRFQNFGPITNVSVHFRDHGDNYGFVTFAYKVDAYEAVERGTDDPNLSKYDISFGGRRAFCKTQYSDLDNIEAEELNPAPIFRREEDSFDILLREMQAKLLKRKV